jgi:hypothetical protein
LAVSFLDGNFPDCGRLPNAFSIPARSTRSFGFSLQLRQSLIPCVTVETVSTWAQLIASTGVIGTLYYLALQVRQSTRSSRAAVVDSLAHSMHDLAFDMAKNDQLLNVVTVTLNDWNGASQVERARAASFLLGYFKVFENAWFQMQQGTLTSVSGKATTLFFTWP